MEKITVKKPTRLRRMQCRAVSGVAFVLFQVNYAMAQDGGVKGINETTQMITGYFDPAVKLIYAIGAICGLIGGIQVYSKVQGGDPDAGKSAGMWFGGCVFLVVVGTVLKAFFAP